MSAEKAARLKVGQVGMSVAKERVHARRMDRRRSLSAQRCGSRETTKERLRPKPPAVQTVYRFGNNENDINTMISQRPLVHGVHAFKRVSTPSLAAPHAPVTRSIEYTSRRYATYTRRNAYAVQHSSNHASIRSAGML